MKRYKINPKNYEQVVFDDQRLKALIHLIARLYDNNRLKTLNHNFNRWNR